MTDAEGLAARLAAMRERQALAGRERKFQDYARTVPLLRALEEGGEPYESVGYNRLVGAANQWAHDPDAGSFAVNDDQPLLLAGRLMQVKEALSRFLQPSGKITVIFRAEALVVRLDHDQVDRHLAEILASGDGAEIGFLLSDGHFLEVRRKLISIGSLTPL